MGPGDSYSAATYKHGFQAKIFLKVFSLEVKKSGGKRYE